jgi:pimeloyl-ACP methyl ester carboxylesterase
MVPLKFSVTLAERIQQATLITIDGAGHMIPRERPDAVAGTIQHWLREALCDA